MQFYHNHVQYKKCHDILEGYFYSHITCVIYFENNNSVYVKKPERNELQEWIHELK